jgi:preprotein translocase subunit SecY
MVPIIFAIAFISFPYLLVNVLYKFHPTSAALASIKTWVENHLNIYSNNPDPLVVILYFFLIVLFTFFYSWVVFKPEKMAEQIQKR